MKKLLAALAVAAGLALSAPAMATETPPYTVEQQEGRFEIRVYPPLIVAEVTVTGDRDDAANAAFRPLAAYIFGANVRSEDIGMTAPVTQGRAGSGGERIGMTAPVTQTAAGRDWVVQFIMPQRYTMETLPRPTNEAIRIREEPGRRVAAVRFSGFATQGALERRTEELVGYIEAMGLNPASPPMYAFYNPPFTLPPLRRNEVMIEVAGP
jgi:hypothetical protein